MSLTEAAANVLVGFAIVIAAQIVVFPIFGLNASLAQNLKLGLIFTLLCGAPHDAVYAERMIMRSRAGHATISC
jgi:hypothetical protein